MRNDLADHPASTQVARVLRTLALNEDLTRRVPFDPLLGPLARKVGRRYVAGEGLSDAMERATEIQTRGHCVNLEYAGKSYRGPAPCGRRDPGVPRGGPSAPGRLLSIAGPLPHRAGDRSGLTLDNAILIAQSTATRGREMVIFAAGSERTDAVVWIHERLCAVRPRQRHRSGPTTSHRRVPPAVAVPSPVASVW